MINNITMVQKQLMILLPVKSVLTKTNDTSQLNQQHLYQHFNQDPTITKYRCILAPLQYVIQ